MKEYKYKINGNTYKVAVGDIDNNVAQVEVNGIPYKVELDSAKKPVTVVSAPRPSAAPRTESGAKVIAKPATGAAGHQVKARYRTVHISESRRHRKGIRYSSGTRSDEDGKRYPCRPRRCHHRSECQRRRCSA